MAKINPELIAVTDELSRNTQNILGDKLRRIILYGSRARGDYQEWSDLDIMVLADYNEQEHSALRSEICKIASDASIDHDITVCMSLNNESLFMSRLHISPYYRNVLSEGIGLYGAE
jgi:predicted nucleotidyltransferase